jgi:ankyrin repeat protein
MLGVVEVVKLLVAAGARVDSQATDDSGPLGEAASGGHLQVVKYLVEEVGVDVGRTSSHGATPLMVAVRNGHGDVVNYMRGFLAPREQEVRMSSVKQVYSPSSDAITRCFRSYELQRRGHARERKGRRRRDVAPTPPASMLHQGQGPSSPDGETVYNSRRGGVLSVS